MKFRNFIILLVLISTDLFSQQKLTVRDKADQELESKNYTKAIDLYTKLIVSQPSDYLLYIKRGTCYANLKRFSLAINDFTIALGLEPPFADKYFILKYRGYSYYQLNKWEEALMDLTVYSDFYDNVEAYLWKSNSLYFLEKYNETIKECKFILLLPKINSIQKIETYELLGLSYLQVDSVTKAKECNQKMCMLDSLSPPRLFLHGLIFQYEENYDSAIQAYTKVIMRDSSELSAIFNRGTMYYQKKEYDLALSDFLIYASKTKDSPEAMYEIAKTERKKKNYDKALQMFVDCLKKEPNSSDICNQISWTYCLLHNYQVGLAYANKSILLDNENEDAYDTRGTIYYKLGEYSSAIEDFTKALNIDSSYANSFYYRGLCYLKNNEPDKACIDWAKLLAVKNYEIDDGEKTTEILLAENCNK